MVCSKWQLAAAICGAIFWTEGGTTITLAGSETEGNLSASNILQKVQEKYASLTNYSDFGEQCLYPASDGTKRIVTFILKCGRPSRYLIEEAWRNPDGKLHRGPRWSANDPNLACDLASMVRSPGQQTCELASMVGSLGPFAPEYATSSPGGTVLEAFFAAYLDNPVSIWFNSSGHMPKRVDDEKLGDLECYVFETEFRNLDRRHFWIGKQDFLIHQVQTVTNVEAVKAAGSGRFSFIEDLRPKTYREYGAKFFTVTETHTNILVNQKLATSDFVPSESLR
jgi:hypothetical protein